MPDHPIAESSTPSPEAVRQQLQAILGSHPFVTATRARRFLTYIVEQTLAGQTDAIKELVLGTQVFDRPADFDPKVDTIVRVEAGKLRKRLEEYYADEGAATPLRIEVPKGSYVPQFVVAAQPSAPEVSAPAAAPRRRFVAGVLALLLISGCAWGVWRFRAPSAPVSPSIAVLPFLNLSADPANEYFADGLAEELTDALCNAGGLRVASRTSAFFFRGKQADAREIGAKLHVAFVVEGSVRKQGDQLKVTAQLIRTDDGYHAWSASFERKLSDVFAVQQELAGSLVNALQVKLTGAQSRRLKKSHTASPQAFDLYLQGKHASNPYTPDSRLRAEQLFRQAVAADPAYALSYTALTDLYMSSNIFPDRPARETVSKASIAIHQALALDDELAEAHAILGSLSARHEYDWASAERHLRHALELNPSSALAHNQLAQNVLAPQGRWQEALAENRLASELEPWLASLERRYDAAEEGFRKLAAAYPGNAMAVFGLAISLLDKGDYPAAVKTFQQGQTLVPFTPLGTLGMMGYAQARMGNAAAARGILRQVQSLEESGKFVPPGCFDPLHGVGRWQPGVPLPGDGPGTTGILRDICPRGRYVRPDPAGSAFWVLLSELGLSDEQVQKNQPQR